MANDQHLARTGFRSRWFAGAVLGAATLALTGCSAVTPLTTSLAYSPSDGVGITLGSSFTAEDLLVVAAADGAPGALIGGLTNHGTHRIRVTLAPQGATALTVDIPAGATILLGGANDPPLRVDKVSVPPGATLPTTASTPDSGSQFVEIPVLDGTQPQYKALVPTPKPSG